MRWLAVRLSVAGPSLLSAGHGIGSFFSTLGLGLAGPDTVEGSVVASDAALEDREACGLSSHVSHASAEVVEPTFEDGDLTCPRMVGLFFTSLAGVACGTVTPCSVQNPGLAKSGRAPCVADFVCFRTGLGLFVVSTLLPLTVLPLELGRRLLCVRAPELSLIHI